MSFILFFVMMAAAFMPEAFSGLLDRILGFLGDEWKDKTLGDILQNDIDGKQEANSFADLLKPFIEPEIKKGIAEALDMDVKELDELMADKEAKQELLGILKKAGADKITIGELQKNKNNSAYLKENVFKPEVINDLLASSKLAPLAAKIAAKPDVLMSAIQSEDIPEKMKGAINEAIKSGELKLDSNALRQALLANAKSDKTPEEKAKEAKNLIRQSIEKALPADTKTKIAEISIDEAFESSAKMQTYLTKFAGQHFGPDAKLPVEHAAKYLYDSKADLEIVFGKEKLQKMAADGQLGQLAQIVDFKQFGNNPESEALLQHIKARAANGDQVDNALARIIKGAPIDHIKVAVTADEIKQAGDEPTAIATKKQQMKNYANLAAALLPVEADRNVLVGGSNLDRILNAPEEVRSGVFSVLSGIDIKSLPQKVREQIQDVIFDINGGKPVVTAAVEPIVEAQYSYMPSMITGILSGLSKVTDQTKVGEEDAMDEILNGMAAEKLGLPPKKINVPQQQK